MSTGNGVWEIVVDGASRGNPGPAAAGFVIREPDRTIFYPEGHALGNATNNQAEYRALVLALRSAARLGARRVQVRSDSELLVRQMRGEYRVRNPHLVPLFEEARRLADSFAAFEIVWVSRAETVEADRLARQALRRSGAAARPAPSVHRADGTPEAKEHP